MGKIIGEGITFDDVLLVPAYSEVIPNQVELKTHLTKKIELNIPMTVSYTHLSKVDMAENTAIPMHRIC